MKRTVVFLLVLAALLNVTSCGGKENAGGETVPDTGREAEAEPTAPETTATEKVQQMMQGQDLGGITFTTLAPDADSHWIYSKRFNEVYAEEVTGEIVNDKLLERNQAAQELLNVDLQFEMRNNMNDIAGTVTANVIAGDKTYDLVLNTMTNQAGHMLTGSLVNAYSIPTLDLSNAWWDSNEVETFTLYDKLYWLCGDINIGDDYAVQVLYFNKDMLVDYGLENPYTAVVEDTWTLEKFYQMTAAVTNDSDGDGKMTLEDTWGLVEANSHIMHWLYAMGEKLVDIEEDGALRLRILDENHVNVINTLYEYMVDKQMVYPGSVNNDVRSFTGEHTLFYSNQLYTLELLRDMEAEFGIIPMPKYSETQQDYGVFISHGGATAFAVPLTNENLETTGIILETLCGLSTDTLRSAFYDVLFSSKLVRDAESVKSLDSIFTNKIYDWGVDFSWGSAFGGIYNDMVLEQENNIVSTAVSVKKAGEADLAELTEVIAELP